MGLLSRNVTLTWACTRVSGPIEPKSGFTNSKIPKMGLMIQESSQSLQRFLVEWETCQNPDYLGKSKNPNLWSGNVKIQHGLLGEPGQNPDYLRNCIPKKWAYMIQECQSNTDWAIIRSAIHLLLKIRFQKKQAPPFKMVLNLAFLGKKRRNYWPRARAERNPDTEKKNVKSGLTLFPSSAYYWFLMRYPKENDLYGYPLKLY